MNPRGQGPPVLSALWAPFLQMETLLAVLVIHRAMAAMELRQLAKIVQLTMNLQAQVQLVLSVF